MSRCIGKNSSGFDCSMVWRKFYSEISPTEEVKEGVTVGEEVGPDDGSTEGLDDGATVGRIVGTVKGLEEGVFVRTGLYSHPHQNWF